MSWSNGLHPQLKPYFERLVWIAKKLDPGARVTSAYRSSADQARLYRRFLAGHSKYPVAPPGRSYHEYGRAIDILAEPEALRRLGAIWEGAGGKWGGERDDIHFQA